MISAASQIATQQGFLIESLRQEEWYKTDHLYCNYTKLKCRKELGACLDAIALWMKNNIWGKDSCTNKLKHGYYGELLLAMLCDKRSPVLEQWFPTLAVHPSTQTSGSNKHQDIKTSWTGLAYDLEAKTIRQSAGYVHIPADVRDSTLYCCIKGDALFYRLAGFVTAEDCRKLGRVVQQNKRDNYRISVTDLRPSSQLFDTAHDKHDCDTNQS